MQVIIAQRKGAQPMFKALTHKRIAPAKFRNLDYSEKNGYFLKLYNLRLSKT